MASLDCAGWRRVLSFVRRAVPSGLCSNLLRLPRTYVRGYRMPSLRDWGRAIWCRIFFGTSPRYLPSRTKIKVKGVGQECPTHTSKVTNNVNGSGRGRPLHAIKTRVKGVGQECPTHMIKKPGAEARLNWGRLRGAEAPLFHGAAMVRGGENRGRTARSPFRGQIGRCAVREMHRSFVGSRPLCVRLRFLRMTTGNSRFLTGLSARFGMTSPFFPALDEESGSNLVLCTGQL
jgi:hypothetical protein